MIFNIFRKQYLSNNAQIHIKSSSTCCLSRLITSVIFTSTLIYHCGVLLLPTTPLFNACLLEGRNRLWPVSAHSSSDIQTEAARCALATRDHCSVLLVWFSGQYQSGFFFFYSQFRTPRKTSKANWAGKESGRNCWVVYLFLVCVCACVRVCV